MPRLKARRTRRRPSRRPRFPCWSAPVYFGGRGRLTVQSRLGLSFSVPLGLAAMAGCPSGQRERSVKPSAKPSLVRTQHLPHPGETARSLRKRGPAGRFLLVTPCITMRHRGSMHGSVHGHIADSVRVKPAVRITAPFADPRPFCPVTGHRTAAHPGRPVLRRPARARRRASLVRTRSRGGLPDRPAPSCGARLLDLACMGFPAGIIAEWSFRSSACLYAACSAA
jgi:hypothetical protein